MSARPRREGGAASPFSSLRLPVYRRYFIAQVVSLIGNWMELIALPWLVYQKTHSGTDLGFIVAVQSLPVLLLSPYGGVIVDRTDTRRLLCRTQAIQGTVALVLGVLVVTHAIAIWMVVLLALANGTTSAFNSPAQFAITIELVGPSELRNAISLNSVTINIARAVGPITAAAVIATAGIGPCFLANACSFAAVVLALWTIPPDALHTTAPQPRARGQLRSGLQYVLRTPEVRTPIVMMALVGTLAYEYPVSLLLLANQAFHGGASTYSLLTTSLGAGAIVSGVWIASRGRTGLRWCALATGEYGILTAVAAFAPGVGVAAIALCCSGVGYIAFNAIGNSTVQLASDPAMRGRVVGLWSLGFQGSTVIGGPIVGALASAAGARSGLAIGAAAALVATAICVGTLRSESVKETAVTPAASEG